MSQSSLFWIYLPRQVLLIYKFQFSSYFLKASLDYGLIISSVPLISSVLNPVINTLGLPLPILYFNHFLSEAFHFSHLIFILLVVFLYQCPLHQHYFHQCPYQYAHKFQNIWLECYNTVSLVLCLLFGKNYNQWKCTNSHFLHSSCSRALYGIYFCS